MSSQRFLVKIDLKLHAVTCPGVWLCSHGYLEVTIKTLGYFFRTGAIEPYFPLLCHDRFKMEGYFRNANSIAALISNLQSEFLEITLWQSGRRLSYYQGVLMDLLNITEPKLHCPHVNTKQLLMKTTTAFPGIIAPKVELSAEFYIKDKVFNLTNIHEELKTATVNVNRNPLAWSSSSTKLIKEKASCRPHFYQRPCIINPESYEDFTSTNGRKIQRAVCHARDFPHKRSQPFEPIYKSNSRRVSLASTSSNNTQSSGNIYDLAQDRDVDIVELHRPDGDCCNLCRLYKEVFKK